MDYQFLNPQKFQYGLFLVINELPYEKRMAKENMIFAGLWFRDKKPAMATFLKPLYEELLFMDKGITVESSERGKFLCRAVLLAGSCDLPARCLVCNSLQFNGEHGCWKCRQQGRTEKNWYSRPHKNISIYKR